MKVLVTADLHLSANPRDAYRHDFQKQLRAIVKKRKIDCVVICGDLTEEKDHHGAWLVNKVVEHIARLAKLCDVVIIKGNHDYVDEHSPFYEFTKRIRGVCWYGQSCDVPDLIPASLNKLGSVMIVPHIPGLKRSPSSKQYDWVFTHLTFQGADVGGRKVKGVPLDCFGRAQVISGDIHVPQTMGKVTYVGAPYLVDFGDHYQPRILLLDKGMMKSLPVTGAQKRLVSIHTLKELEPGSTPIRNVSPGDILKVRYLVTPENKADWQNIQKRIREWGDQFGVMIYTIQPVMLESLREQPRKKALRKASTKDDEALLRSYAKHRQIDERTLKVGLNLMRRV